MNTCSAKQHYDDHLAPIYSWMLGNFNERLAETEAILDRFGIVPEYTEASIDFGAGNGIMALALAKRGFSVTAVEQNEHLKEEIGANTRCYSVQPTLGDLRNVTHYASPQPELIVCAGDTLAHLKDWDEIERFIADCASILPPLGKLYLSFRDYSYEPDGTTQTIEVRNTPGRTLTCELQYETERVKVTDIVNEMQTDHTWVQSVSSYYKVRLSTQHVIDICDTSGFLVLNHETVNGMVHLLLLK